MPRQPIRFRSLVAVALALCASAAFSGEREDKAARFYEDALVRFEKDDTAGAIIQLRNALQQDPGMLAAQILMGRAHLKKGEPSAAEVAFQKALQLGVNRTEIVIPLAQAYLEQGKYAAVLERAGPDGLAPARRAELLVIRAAALTETGRSDDAQAALREARDLDPGQLTPLVQLANLAIVTGERNAAARYIEQAVTEFPRDPRAWNLRAQSAHLRGDLQAALRDYDKAIALDAVFADARVARAGILLDLRREKDAVAEIEKLVADLPGEPRAAYLHAVILSRRGDDQGMRKALDAVTRALDPVPMELIARRPQPLLLAGLAHYGLKEFETAQPYLEAYLRLFPKEAGVRKLLGSILLQGRRARDAIAVLEGAVQHAPNDGDAAAMLASAYMADRQHAKAANLLERALKLGAAAPTTKARLGFNLVGMGREDLAFQHLREANAADPGDPRFAAGLTLLHLRRGEAKQAVEVAAAIVRRDPKSLAGHNLLGVAKAAAGDRAGARAAYGRALAIDPGFAPAVLNLGKLELLEGRTDAARTRFVALLKLRPRDSQAMYELAAAEASVKRFAEAEQWLQKANAQDRNSPAAGIALVELHLRRGAVDRALAVAKDLDGRFNDRLEVLEVLGRAHAASGNTKLAHSIFNRMTTVAEFDPNWQSRIAQLQMAAGNLAGARYSVEKAQTAGDEHLPAQTLAVEIELMAGDFAKAETLARAVVAKHPGRAVGHSLLADIAAGRGNWSEAVAGYRSALAREETTDGVLRLFQAYARSGSPAKAVELVENWLRRNPQDLLAKRALAEGYLRVGNHRAARGAYEDLLIDAGDDPMVLNNYAQALFALGDRDAAGVAEKALAAAPNDATINDTVGWILVSTGQADRGLRHLREARLREPGNGEIRYHLAWALAKAGRQSEARQELEEALRARLPMDSGEAARRLMAELERR